MIPRSQVFRVLAWGLIGLLAVATVPAHGGGLLFRKRQPRTVVTTVRPVRPDSAGPLGTFTPTPYATVRGDYPTGGGYSPNDQYGGDTSMDIYGPLSVYRATEAPIPIYTRGYDGRTVVVEGTSFSTPNFAAGTPVVYPTQGTYYYGFRQSDNPPWWPKVINWIDQN